MNIRVWNSGVWMRSVLVCLTIVNLYPLLFTIMTSLKTSDEFFSDIWAFPRSFLIDNYKQAFEVGRLGEYFYNSVVIALVSLTMVTVVAAFAAYALARLQVPFAGAIVGLLLVIQILPTESMVLPLYMMMSKLKLLGVTYVPITSAYIGWLLPGTIVILRNFFLSIPSELLESARIDGSGEISTMFRIAFPLTGGAIATCTVLNFCFVWGELLWAQISTLTTERGLPLTVGLINFQGQYSTNWGLMTAAICMILIPLFVLFVMLQKYFVQGLTSGAVKG
ncbi:carbohydrate ABC transporter permease [Paenibacillaceae bacterium WGS1546]|uniref:carbohydrate ABC transporter permease n=1 Tax=Cohnella sp. WGS1546 TaxID=3366810 RepID=UPI00372D6E13